MESLNGAVLLWGVWPPYPAPQIHRGSGSPFYRELELESYCPRFLGKEGPSEIFNFQSVSNETDALWLTWATENKRSSGRWIASLFFFLSNNPYFKQRVLWNNFSFEKEVLSGLHKYWNCFPDSTYCRMKLHVSLSTSEKMKRGVNLASTWVGYLPRHPGTPRLIPSVLKWLDSSSAWAGSTRERRVSGLL